MFYVVFSMLGYFSLLNHYCFLLRSNEESKSWGWGNNNLNYVLNIFGVCGSGIPQVMGTKCLHKEDNIQNPYIGDIFGYQEKKKKIICNSGHCWIWQSLLT